MLQLFVKNNKNLIIKLKRLTQYSFLPFGKLNDKRLGEICTHKNK